MEPKHGAHVLLVVSLLAALLHPTAACIAEERTALLAFKAGITEDPQGMLTRWVANGDCCAWGGTLCDDSGHVTQVDLAPDPAFDDDTVFLKGMAQYQNWKMFVILAKVCTIVQNLNIDLS